MSDTATHLPPDCERRELGFSNLPVSGETALYVHQNSLARYWQ